jgi:hypothetical protein
MDVAENQTIKFIEGVDRDHINQKLRNLHEPYTVVNSGLNYSNNGISIYWVLVRYFRPNNN